MKTTTDSPSIDKEADNDDENDLFQMMASYWADGMDQNDQEAVIKCNSVIIIEKEIIQDVSVILNIVADKADKLINNVNTNLAENWMSIRSKFGGGKQIN